MQLYKIIDGAYLGFYRERGGTVFISGYRTVQRTVCDWKLVEKTVVIPESSRMELKEIKAHMEEVQFWVPESEVEKTRVVPGHYETETVYIQGHYETKEIWIPEHDEEHFVEVPGYFEMRRIQEPGQYERQNIWVPEYYVTRYYWQEAVPARGIVGHWVEYQELIPAGYKLQRVWVPGRWVRKEFWVDATWEYQTVTVPGQFRDHRVWVDGNYEDRPFWVPETEEKYTEEIPGFYQMRLTHVPYWSEWVSVVIPAKLEVKEVNEWVCEEIEVQEPIYSYYGAEDEYDLVDRQRGPIMVIAGPPEGDKLQLRIIESGDIIEVEAKYLGLVTRTEFNEYILP